MAKPPSDDDRLREARRHVAPGVTECVKCKASFDLSGDTLLFFNALLSLEDHACPACGQRLLRVRGVLK